MESEDFYIDSYRLVAKLGSGAFGNVFLAQHAILTNRIVAIKLMHITDVDSSQAIFRFFTEAQILNKPKDQHYGSWSNVLGPQFRGSVYDVAENLNKDIEAGKQQARRVRRTHHSQEK